MTDNIAETAIEILRATNDGDDIDPAHLKLLELAVNGFLSPRGHDAFQELLAKVRAGYTKPWLHGVTFITIDLEGYVYWKAHRIEHFSLTYASLHRARPYVQELAQRCQPLEDNGITPSFAVLSPPH